MFDQSIIVEHSERRFSSLFEQSFNLLIGVANLLVKVEFFGEQVELIMLKWDSQYFSISLREVDLRNTLRGLE